MRAGDSSIRVYSNGRSECIQRCSLADVRQAGASWDVDAENPSSASGRLAHAALGLFTLADEAKIAPVEHETRCLLSEMWSPRSPVERRTREACRAA